MILPMLQPRLHSWTCEEFNRIAESGAFEGLAIELIDGAVIDMSPIGSPHSAIVSLINGVLYEVYHTRDQFVVRCQLPLMLDESSQPQPDLAVVPGKARDYLLRHPAHALLVVEVADTSLAFDRGIKAERYSQANIQEYWIVNLIDEQIEVYRRSESALGFATPEILRRGERVALPALHNITLAVSDLLP